VEERSMGNAEFRRAEQAQREAILAMNLPEAECFLMEFLPSYELTLDEQDLPDQPQAGAAGQSE
jgi:5'-deoxynucleotidase